MTDYDDIATEVMASEAPTREQEKAAEVALDLADEQRRAEQDAAEPEPEDDGEDCHAEFIDGSYTYCGCEDCEQRETRDGEDEA